MSDKQYIMKDYTLPREKIAELEESHRSLRDKRQADRVRRSLVYPEDGRGLKRVLSFWF